MPEINQDILTRITQILGANSVKRSGLAEHMDAGCHPRNLDADVAVTPASTDEMSAVLALCNEYAVTVVPHGGRTGLSGGAESQPGQLIVMVTGPNQIVHIDPDSTVAVVEALSKLVDPGKLKTMRMIRHSLDPNEIMNPGKVF